MAKICIEYDTNEKTAKVTRDGEEVPNVHAVGIQKKWTTDENKPGKYYLDMHQQEKDPEHDVLTQHHTMAAEQVPAAAKDVVDAPGLPGFKVVSKKGGDVVSDIVKYFSPPAPEDSE